MSAVTRSLAHGLAAVLVAGYLSPAVVLAEDTPAPRYTYLGAGYEWGDSKCAIEPQGTRLSGYTVEGSVGILQSLHLIGAYYDGETSGPPDNFDEKMKGSCLELGAGVSYSFAPGADVVLRGYWVDVDIEHTDIDENGFEPELLVRYAMSEKAEVEVGMAYYDLDDFDNSEVRLALVYNVMPWLAIRVGGKVFDDDSSLSAGVRAYFGGNLF